MKETVRAIMAEVFDTDPASIDDNATMETVENWDSLSHINLIMALEQRFGVSFDQETIASMVTLPEIVRVLAAAESSRA